MHRRMPVKRGYGRVVVYFHFENLRKAAYQANTYLGIAEVASQHSFDPVDIVTEVINRAEAALEIAKAEGGNKAHSIAPNLQALAVL